ncbi:MAG: alpha/beta hydrolase [Actinobacteria bacterium]|nr:alpha/beta hydrolase [Actinomycetota bacterium]
MRRALTLIIAGSVSLALSATPSQALVPSSDAPPVSASSASRTATTIPATLAASAPTAIPYTPPALNWRSCGSSMPSTARCATLVVPRDWGSKRVAGTYDIAVARIPASSPGKRRGVLTFNPGGPGSAALSNISWVYGLLPTKVRERFDLVAWDPRGVGMSQPVISGCNGKSPHAAPTGPVDWKAWVTKFVKAQAATAAACLKLNRDTAPYVGTWQIVHDVDALREALGEETLSFWGMSYGSTVGRAYAQYFPSRVRALLLDGVISPVSTIELWSREHTWDDPAAINTMLDAFGPEYRRKYAVVFSALDTKTLPYEGGRLNRWEAGYSIIQWASFQTTWSSARYLIDRLYDAASKRSSRSIKRAARASAWFDPHYTYVNCADMPDRPSIDQLTAIAEEGFRSGGVPVAQSALREGAQCAGLPSLGRPLGQITVPITLSTPPLIANSIADNRTPWSAALEMVEAFTGAGLVRYGGTHHIIYGRTTPCVHEPITRYLTKLKVPAAEVRCPLVWYG